MLVQVVVVEMLDAEHDLVLLGGDLDDVIEPMKPAVDGAKSGVVVAAPSCIESATRWQDMGDRGADCSVVKSSSSA